MAKAYSFAGTTMTVLVSGAETNGAFAVLHVIKPPGSSTPPHSHDRELELSYVLSGTLSVETEGRTDTRAPGEHVVLSPRRPHRLFNDSGEMVREFLICSPAIFDRFVAAAGSPVEPYSEPRPMTGEERQRLVDLAPDFGVRLLRSAVPDAVTATPSQQATGAVTMLGPLTEIVAQLGPAHDLVLTRHAMPPGRDLELDGQVDLVCFFVIEGAPEVYREGIGWTPLHPNEALLTGINMRCFVRNTTHAPACFLLVSTAQATKELEVAIARSDARHHPLGCDP